MQKEDTDILEKEITKVASLNEVSKESQSSSPFLVFLKKDRPVSKHWGKIESLTISQAVFLYYGIEPHGSNNSIDPLFPQFIQRNGDVDRIFELMNDSISSETLSVLPNGKIETKRFCAWLKQKNFSIPDILMHIFDPPNFNNLPSIIFKTLDDVQNLDVNQLSDSVLKSLGANIIAQAYKRAALKNPKKSKNKIKISDVIGSQCMEKFMGYFSDNGQVPDNSTIRKYIENQFRD